MTRSALAMTAVLALALGAGCVTSFSTGKPIYTLKRHFNAWDTTLAVPIEKAHKATVAGLADLGLKTDTSRVDKLTGLADGTMADGTYFEIKLETLGDSLTLVRIRSGVFGDRMRATQLFRAIEARL